MPAMTEAEIDALPYRPCVGLMILNTHGHVFAGQRIDNASDAWQMPQGGVDPGETDEQAALRELTEETGMPASAVRILRQGSAPTLYDLPRDLVPKLWDGRYRGQRQTWFALRYTGPNSGIDIQTDQPEFRAWAWMPHDVLIERIVPFKRDTYTTVFTDFQDLLP